MTLTISIITGTYNRLPYLQQMMQSARQQIPVGLAYEFVICDGGSTDGTLDWLRSQPDVKLVEHGELRGAIRAFTDAAEAAQGKYVLIANDDIVFHEGSILRALVYLENNMNCGAVAMADDRPSPGKQGHAVMRIQAQVGGVHYAQVGLFRKWLGDKIGWWYGHGAMEGARTYGADAYLSARIWELGYTVDPVDGVAIDDRIVEDGLRAANSAEGGKDSQVFMSLYPGGVPVSPAPKLENPDKRQLRILYLPIYERDHPAQHAQKRGLRDALAKYYLVYELDYVALGANLRTEFNSAIETFQPDLILTQFHGASAETAQLLAEARASLPRIVIVNWNGDYWPHNLISPEMLRMLRQVDLQLTVNGGVIDTYTQNQIPAAYWQIGYEDPSTSSGQVPPSPLPDTGSAPGAGMPKHNVVFLASVYSAERAALGKMLVDEFQAGIYGHGWPFETMDTTYDFAAGAALYAGAKISIGDNQFVDNYGFVSNRFFQALAAGGSLLLHQKVNGLQELTGITPGVHFIEWMTLDELRQHITYFLNPKHEKERKRIAAAGCKFVRENHSFDQRVRQLFIDLLPKAQRTLKRFIILEYLGTLEEGGAVGRLTQIQYHFKRGERMTVDSLDAPYFLSEPHVWREVTEEPVLWR